MSEHRCDWARADSDDRGAEAWEEERERAEALFAETRNLENNQRTWHDMNLWNSTLYSNRELPAFHWGEPILNADDQLYPANLTTENLVKSVGDSMISKGSSSPLMPTGVPRGASFKTRKQVRKLNKWLRGTWKQLNCEDLAIRALLDAFICGLGVIKVDYTDAGITAESVFFDNVIIDNRECVNRGPVSTYRIRSVVPRASVEATYASVLGERGLDNEVLKQKYVEYRTPAEGYVVVVEAWRLPIGKTPGRHVIACGGRLLVDEPWEQPWAPLVVMHWEDRLSGFMGPSGVEQVIPYQVKLNDINERIDDAQELTVNPRLLIQAGSKVDVNSFDNQPGRMVMYTGVEPKPLVWPAVPVEFYNERERVRQSCLEFFGLSQMSSQGVLPQGVRLDSSRALNEARTMEDSRFLRLWTRYEDFRMSLAKLLVDVMIHDPSAERDHVTSWSAGGRARTEEIKWKDIGELRKDNFSWSLEALPASFFSPAVQQDRLDSAASEGLVGPDEKRNFVGQPDLERMEQLEMASVWDITRHIEMLEDGVMEPPDELTNLIYGVPKVIYNALDLKSYEDVPDEVMSAHYQWIAIARGIQTMAVTDPTMQAPGPGPTMGMAGMDLPNNHQGLPGQPFSGSLGAPAAPPVANGAPLPPSMGPI